MQEQKTKRLLGSARRRRRRQMPLQEAIKKTNKKKQGEKTKGEKKQAFKTRKTASNFSKLKSARIKREQLRVSTFAATVKEFIHSNTLCYGLIEVFNIGGAYSKHLGINYRTVKVREVRDLETKPIVKNQERVLLFIVIESWQNGNINELQINQKATKVITSVAELEGCTHPDGYFKLIRKDDFEQMKKLVSRIKKRVAKNAAIERNHELMKKNEEMFT